MYNLLNILIGLRPISLEKLCRQVNIILKKTAIFASREIENLKNYSELRQHVCCPNSE